MKILIVKYGSLLLLATALYSNTAFAQMPILVSAPASQAVAQGGTAVLSFSVAGPLPITYTWHRNFEFTNYYQATLYSTNCTLTLNNMQPQDACFLNIDARNAYGQGASAQVVVAVISAGMATNGFALSIRGLTNSSWTVKYTMDLASPTWIPLTNFSVPRNPPWFYFVDLAATNLNRYYQVIPKVN